MERRKAFLVAGAVTFSAFAGATAVGASTGLLGFAAAPAPAAADAPVTETRIVHVPGRSPSTTVPSTQESSSDRSPSAGRSAPPTGTITPPVAPTGEPPVTSTSSDAAPEPTEPPVTDPPAGTPTVTSPEGDDQVEPPSTPETPEHEGDSPEVEQPESPGSGD